MKFEEYLLEFEPIMLNMCKKYEGLHMEHEDKLQECYLILFTKLDKLEEKESIEHKRAYFKTCLDGHFKSINIKEHEQRLRDTYSLDSKQDDFSNEVIEFTQISDIEQKVIDPFLERIYQQRRDAAKRWNAKNKDKISKYQKTYYEKNKEQIKEKQRQYYQQNKEVFRERYQKRYNEKKETYQEYYQKNKEYKKIYYQEYYKKNSECCKERAKRNYYKNKETIERGKDE